MNIVDYFNKINACSQKIYQETLLDSSSFGKAQHLSTCIFEFAENLNDAEEKKLFNAVSSQIESGSLILSLGFYRQAFFSLRLVLEMGLGAVYFSLFKLEYQEWLKGKADIKWSKLIDSDNGVLSKRLTDAFFPELSEDIDEYNKKARTVYRELSEFVHGNHETWVKSGLILSKNDEFISHYFTYLESVQEVLLFTLSCRYLKVLSPGHLEDMNFILEDFSHIEPIRVLLGGPKEQ